MTIMTIYYNYILLLITIVTSHSLVTAGYFNRTRLGEAVPPWWWLPHTPHRTRPLRFLGEGRFTLVFRSAVVNHGVESWLNDS